MTFQEFSSTLNVVLTVCMVVGGIFALRKGIFQTSNNLQQTTIETLQAEVASLRRKMDDMDKERATQDRVIATIRYALKSRGLRIIIQGDYVTLKDNTGKSLTTPIQDRAQVQPLHDTEDEEDDSKTTS